MSERLVQTLSDLGVSEESSADGIRCFAVERARLTELMQRLRDVLGFETTTFVTAIDHFPATPRFQLVYQFLSLAHNDRVRILCRIEEDDAVVPTITCLWPGTSFLEREVYDMFGIRFADHPDLRRLLMPQEYDHHPLRKDFPHQGIEPDRLYREWDARRRTEEVS